MAIQSVKLNDLNSQLASNGIDNIPKNSSQILFLEKFETTTNIAKNLLTELNDSTINRVPEFDLSITWDKSF